jgi:hypothetical protein
MKAKAFTCCRRTRKTKTEDRKVDIMPVLADAGWGLEPIMPIEKKCYSYLQEGIQTKIQFVRKLIPKMNFAGRNCLVSAKMLKDAISYEGGEREPSYRKQNYGLNVAKLIFT